MDIVREVEKYIGQVLQAEIAAFEKLAPTNLPFYLTNKYCFFKGKLFSEDIILMVNDTEKLSPSQIKKDYTKCSEILGEFLIFVSKNIASYERQRLINYGIQFIVPNKQMFIPLFKIDLRENFSYYKKSHEIISPSSQLVILAFIYNLINNDLRMSDLVEEFGFSKMSAVRVFDNLETLGLFETYLKGRERFGEFKYTGKQLWDKAYNYLKTPVSKSFYIRSCPNMDKPLLAGLSALAEYTMLSEPGIKETALNSKQWKSYRNNCLLTDYPEEAVFKIEVWRYDPQLLQSDGVVDKLSLYLSLKNTEDERVKGELDNMLEDFNW